MGVHDSFADRCGETSEGDDADDKEQNGSGTSRLRTAGVDRPTLLKEDDRWDWEHDEAADHCAEIPGDGE